MAVKRYDGSAWQTVAGLGAQGPAATSSSIATWVKTASGGETSLSGNDDNSQALSYTVGQELVFINGTLLKRGSDYTATNGTSITGLTALAANDVATVWTVNAFSVTGAIANTIVDAKGDILVGTAADTPGRLAVGTDGYVLTAASTTGTGLTWAAIPASSGPSFSAYVGTAHTVTAATWTKMQFNTENWDTDNCYDTTLYRFTPNKAGKYQVNVGDFLYDGADYRMDLYKNGSQHKTIGYMEPEPSGLQPAFFGSTLVDMNGSTDYLEVYVFMRKSGGTRRVEAGSIISRFDATWIRS